MYNIRLLRRAILPAGATVALGTAVFSVSAKAPPPPPPKDCDPGKRLIRPRDLPIYRPDTPDSESESSLTIEPNPILDLIAYGREELLASLKQLEQVQNVFWDTIRTGKAHTEASLDMLRSEENEMMRYGAIAGGGLLGLIISIRKGKFKKLIYMSTCALGMAALCYPEEASIYSEDAMWLGKRYGNIAYHFAMGVLNDMGVSVPKVSNPVDYVQQLLGLKESIKGPGSSVLLPPVQETPSHVVQLPTSKSSN